jgi:hypothetical protein
VVDPELYQGRIMRPNDAKAQISRNLRRNGSARRQTAY